MHFHFDLHFITRSVVECVGRGRRTPPIIVCPVPVGDAGFVAPVEPAESAVAGEDIFIKNNLFFVVYTSEITILL